MCSFLSRSFVLFFVLFYIYIYIFLAVVKGRRFACRTLFYFNFKNWQRKPKIALTFIYNVLLWCLAVLCHCQEFSDNLRESGVHGALMVLEPSFNSDTLATALAIPPSKCYIRRHLASELDTLLRPARYVHVLPRDLEGWVRQPMSGCELFRNFWGELDGVWEVILILDSKSDVPTKN